MDVEAITVTASVSRAILAIPGAIKDLRTLLANGPKSDIALERLRSLQCNIEAFCNVHAWLREAKELHDRLTMLDNMLEGAFQETVRAVAQGPFNPEAFNVVDARRSWRAANTNALNKLLSFAKNIKHLCGSPLHTDGMGAFMGGPVWASRLIELQNQIDALFKQYDGGDQNAKYLLCEALSVFCGRVRAELIAANEAIRDQASELADALNRLQGALTNV
jgi:hypothetical protein